MNALPNWADGPLTSFDVESTGVNAETDRIVTASVVTINDGPTRIRSWLANPGIDIPAGATAVHGITTEHAKTNGDEPRRVVSEIAHALIDAWSLGHPVVIFNAPFDLSLVDCELRRYGYDGLAIGGLVVDPLVLDKVVIPRRSGAGCRRLTYVCKHVYSVPLSDEDAHSSSADALAAARVFWKIAKRYPRIGEMPAAELMALQAGAAREQALSLQDYFRRQGKDEVIDPSWPIRPFVPVDGGMFPAPAVAPASVGLL